MPIHVGPTQLQTVDGCERRGQRERSEPMNGRGGGNKNRGQHWQMVWEIGQRGGGTSGRRVKEKRFTDTKRCDHKFQGDHRGGRGRRQENYTKLLSP